MPFIHATTTAFPPNYYSQESLLEAAKAVWPKELAGRAFERFFRKVCVDGRHLALPVAEYANLDGFRSTNSAWVRVATELGEVVMRRLFDRGRLQAEDLSQLTFTTITGIAVPSIDARLMNRLPLRRDLKRAPLFGLGCLGGAAGVARVADYLRGHPTEAAALLSIELCSLTIQRADFSVPNMISSGLFGDGAAAVLMVGDEHPLANDSHGPRVVDSLSVFYPDTEGVMGWDVVDTGFRIVLSSDVPRIAHDFLRPDLERFLEKHDLSIPDIGRWVVHPGGPKVIDAMEKGLSLPSDALRRTRESLARVGNLSSASVLCVLDQVMSEKRPSPGTHGILIAMGPAFCAEMVLLRW